MSGELLHVLQQLVTETIRSTIVPWTVPAGWMPSGGLPSAAELNRTMAEITSREAWEAWLAREGINLDAVQRLGEAMSDLSEEHWSAGWMSGTERTLPVLVRDILSRGPREYGMYELSVDEARKLQTLRDEAGAWATLSWADNDIEYLPFDPFPYTDGATCEARVRGIEQALRYIPTYLHTFERWRGHLVTDMVREIIFWLDHGTNPPQSM